MPYRSCFCSFIHLYGNPFLKRSLLQNTVIKKKKVMDKWELFSWGGPALVLAFTSNTAHIVSNLSPTEPGPCSQDQPERPLNCLWSAPILSKQTSLLQSLPATFMTVCLILTVSSLSDFSFLSTSLLKMHHESCHPSLSSSFISVFSTICPVSNRAFTSLDDWKINLSSLYSNRLWTCQLCAHKISGFPINACGKNKEFTKIFIKCRNFCKDFLHLYFTK